MTEDQICAKAVQFIWNNYPQTRNCLIHIPNEAKRSVVEHGQMKAKGLIKGAQDYIFLWDKKCYMIEMKDATGKVRPEQLNVHAAHLNQGITTHVFRDSETFIAFIEQILNQGVTTGYEKYLSL